MYCREVTSREFFVARRKCRKPQYLSAYSLAEMRQLGAKGWRFYLNQSRTGGYMLAPDGDLQSVFNSGVPGTGQEIVKDALHHGAVSLDCFDGFLPRYYARFGFKEVRRERWNPAFKPPGWMEDTTPDVVYMHR